VGEGGEPVHDIVDTFMVRTSLTLGSPPPPNPNTKPSPPNAHPAMPCPCTLHSDHSRTAASRAAPTKSNPTKTPRPDCLQPGLE
jgi:hypothetical protein